MMVAVALRPVADVPAINALTSDLFFQGFANRVLSHAGPKASSAPQTRRRGGRWLRHARGLVDNP